MLYISAIMAIGGAGGDQYFVERVPGTLNPIISETVIYAAVLALGIIGWLCSPLKGVWPNMSASLAGSNWQLRARYL